VLCMLANINRAKGKPERKPEDFDPYAVAERKGRAVVADKESLEFLRDTLMAWKGKKKNG